MHRFQIKRDRANSSAFSADLNKINSELEKGCPVIAGVKLFGSEHYVVITGYSGSTYYINDPYYGTNSKLSDHYGSDPASARYRILPYHVTSNSEFVLLIGDVYKNVCDITGTLSLNVNEFIFNGRTAKFGIKGDLPVIMDRIHNFMINRFFGPDKVVQKTRVLNSLRHLR